MIKHRLMLSAAAAAMLAAALATARADTEISTSTSTALNTITSGNITIVASGSVGITKSGVAAVTLNNNSFILNNGFVANTGTDGALGVSIDTALGNIIAPATGFSSTGSIDLGGSGTSKRGIVISGGNTFYGSISFTNLIATALTGASAVTQQSTMTLQGDSSAAFVLAQGTKVTSNILLAGGGIVQNGSVNSTSSNSIVVDLDGTVNGNVLIGGGISGVGAGLIGVAELGGIHSCASDTGRPAGFTCPSSSGGSLVNAGAISLIGSQSFNNRGGNPESASAIVIGGSIDGGFLNAGPGTSSNVNQALLSSSGLVLSGVTNPTLLIDPSRSITGALTAPRGPIVIGPVTSDIDPINPGYSFINRGTITAQPTDSELSTAAVVIQGNSPNYFTCLSSVAATCDTTAYNNVSVPVATTTNGVTTTRNVLVNNLGGLLNTGTIQAVAGTNSQTVTSSGITTATALYIGPYTFVPRLDVQAQNVSGSSATAGTITATVSGIGQGSAFGVIVGPNANVPVINIGKGAGITAQVNTNTFSPTKNIASARAPFSLVSEAISDQSGTLKAINNAGTIQASNTILSPATGAVTSSLTN
ncbi:MAG: hypothetical protein NTX21_03345, partial [Alphaproteobacteria bacterium]|nr:hypothetical protein [Alphaproteobacteria bacterium]